LEAKCLKCDALGGSGGWGDYQSLATTGYYVHSACGSCNPYEWENHEGCPYKVKSCVQGKESLLAMTYGQDWPEPMMDSGNFISTQPATMCEPLDNTGFPYPLDVECISGTMGSNVGGLAGNTGGSTGGGPGGAGGPGGGDKDDHDEWDWGGGAHQPEDTGGQGETQVIDASDEGAKDENALVGLWYFAGAVVVFIGATIFYTMRQHKKRTPADRMADSDLSGVVGVEMQTRIAARAREAETSATVLLAQQLAAQQQMIAASMEQQTKMAQAMQVSAPARGGLDAPFNLTPSRPGPQSMNRMRTQERSMASGNTGRMNTGGIMRSQTPADLMSEDSKPTDETFACVRESAPQLAPPHSSFAARPPQPAPPHSSFAARFAPEGTCAKRSTET
jgi:hypothetical protein